MHLTEIGRADLDGERTRPEQGGAGAGAGGGGRCVRARAESRSTAPLGMVRGVGGGQDDRLYMARHGDVYGDEVGGRRRELRERLEGEIWAPG